MERRPRVSWTEFEALLPDLATGARAAIAIVLPMALSIRLALPELAWMAFGGWLGTLTDPGGSRGLRARVLVGFSVLGALVVWVCQVSAHWPPTAIALLAVIAFLGSLLRALGSAAGVMGTTLAIVAAIGTALPSNASLRDALWFAAGGGLAVVLSSIVWPIWRHLPVRRSVATVYEELSSYAVELIGCLDAEVDDDERWTTLARRHPRLIRQAVEQARATSLAVHARRSGESAMGSNLRLLLGLAESQFLLLVTLATELEGAPPAQRVAQVREGLERLMRRDEEVRAILLARSWRRRSQKAAPPSSTPADDGGGILTRLERESSVALSLVGGLDRLSGTEQLPAVTESPAHRGSLWEELWRLRDAFSQRSPIFRHAVRVACAAAVAAFAGTMLSPQHAPWVSITALAILQPYTGATVRRAAERVVGTLLGCLLVVGIAAWSRSPLALVLLMFPLSMAAVVTRPRSYRLFTFFLTPVFVLIAMRSPGDWWTAATRAADALLGGALALTAALVIYPRWEERIGMPAALETMLREVERYRDLVRGALGTQDPTFLGKVAEARRSAGIAISEAENSLERRLAEPLRRGTDEARAMDLVTFARRLALAVTALDMRAAHSEAGSGLAAELQRVQRLSELLQRASIQA